MMKLSLASLAGLVFLIGSASAVKAQHVYQIRADSVRIYNVCDTAELIIENRTRGISGYLYNKGNGRTEFRKIDLVQIGGTKLAIAGQDTIDLAQMSGIGGIDSAKYILNQTLPVQTANFNIKGYGRITRNGSANYSTGFMLVPASGPGTINMQLNGESVPGIAIWAHDGTSLKLHSTFHADGTFSKYGTVGNMAMSSDGMELSFSRGNANYIRANNAGGYFNFITGGNIRNDTASALTLYANKTAVFRGGVRMDSLPAKNTPATRLLAIDNGVIGTRTADQLAADIPVASRIPQTTNPAYVSAYTGDLDSITNTGIFHIGQAGHKPSVQPGYLYAGGNNGGASTYKFQLFGAYNTENELFFRQGISGGNWGPWHKVATENWVKNRLTADSLKVIRNDTALQTGNFRISGRGMMTSTITNTILTGASKGSLQLFGGADGPSSGRGGQILLYGGSHDNNSGQIVFHTGTGLNGALQPEVMRIKADGMVGIGTAAPTTLLHVNGAVTATAFYQSSLRSLKKNIQPFTGSALGILGKASIRTFQFKADSTGHQSIGFIADEVPSEIATPGKNGVDQANVVGLLVKAIQELKAEKDAMEADLKAKNTALEARLKSIEDKLQSKK